MNMARVTLLISPALLCVSCKFFTPSTESSKVKYFDVLSDSGLLHSKIFKKTLTVCLTYEESRASYDEKKYPTDQSSGGTAKNPAPPAAPAQTYIPYERLGEQIKKAVLLWVEPLRSLAPNRTLIRDVKIITEGCKLDNLENTEISDITVTFLDQPSVFSGQDGVGGVYQSFHLIGVENPPGYILFGNLLTFSTILHEFGHAFGLSDTYAGATGTKCQFGQPDSVMCLEKKDFTTLQTDDINGVKYKFCSFHKAEFPACALYDSLQAGPVTKQDGRVLAEKLGLVVEDFPLTTYYKYEVAATFQPSLQDGYEGWRDWRSETSIYSTSKEKKQEIQLLNPGKAVSTPITIFTLTGAKVVQLKRGSQAESAGLKVGQLIVKVAEQSIAGANNFYENLGFLHSESVEIRLEGIPTIDSGLTAVKTADSEKQTSIYNYQDPDRITINLP